MFWYREVEGCELRVCVCAHLCLQVAGVFRVVDGSTTTEVVPRRPDMFVPRTAISAAHMKVRRCLGHKLVMEPALLCLPLPPPPPLPHSRRRALHTMRLCGSP